MRFNGPLSDCQTESGASRVPRAPLIDSIEAIEHPGRLWYRNEATGCRLQLLVWSFIRKLVLSPHKVFVLRGTEQDKDDQQKSEHIGHVCVQTTVMHASQKSGYSAHCLADRPEE